MKKNIPRSGAITVSITRLDNNRIEISISDDGTGIDIERLRDMYVKQGAISKQEAEKQMEQELLPLIFQSGFTTSAIITDISGRGLGLAIVREKTDRLGGWITVINLI